MSIAASQFRRGGCTPTVQGRLIRENITLCTSNKAERSTGRETETVGPGVHEEGGLEDLSESDEGCA